MTLTRGDLVCHGLADEKSAEVIVAVVNELRTDTAEVSLNDEGLNIKWFQMLYGGLPPLAGPALR